MHIPKLQNFTEQIYMARNKSRAALSLDLEGLVLKAAKAKIMEPYVLMQIKFMITFLCLSSLRN